VGWPESGGGWFSVVPARSEQPAISTATATATPLRFRKRWNNGAAGSVRRVKMAG